MFLPELLDLMCRHQVIACDQAGTAFWYAASLGKSVIISSNHDKYQWWGQLRPREIVTNNYNYLSTVAEYLLDLPIGEVIEPTPKLLEIALNEIGWNETEEFQLLIANKSLTKKSEFNLNLAQPITGYIEYHANLRK